MPARSRALDALVGELQERKNGSIVLLGRDGNEVARWNFVRAWPTKWTGPNLDAGGSEASIETLELVHEGIEVHKW